MAVAVLAAATVFGVAWRRRYGRLRPLDDEVPNGPWSGAGARVTLLQFSSVTCGPCRQVRTLCAHVAAGTDGVAHIEIDVDRDLGTAQRFGVWRVPTLVVVSPTGRAVWRAVGVPKRSALEAAVADALDRQVA